MRSDFKILALAASKLEVRKADLFREFLLRENCRGELGELPPALKFLEHDRLYDRAAGELEQWGNWGIGIVVLGQPGYPAALARIDKPPLYLTYKGELPEDLDARRAVAIVGARRADVEGEKIAGNFAAALSALGVCVVSGLALGIDGAAHRGALQAGANLPTIAVLGNGLDTVYPPSNRKLAEQILSRGGVLISQFPAGEKPYPGNFLERNRIIAALSQAVLVIQAGERSGSLVTARYGLELGKEVLVVPGSILGQRYVGSNKLIKQGAAPVTSVQDIQEALSEIWRSQGGAAGEADLADKTEQHPVLCVLKEVERLTVAELEGRMKNPANLQHELFELELAGLIERRPGNIIALK